MAKRRRTKKEILEDVWGVSMFAGDSALAKADVTGRRVFAQDLVASLERRGFIPVARKKTADKRAQLKGHKGWYDYYLKKAYRDLGVL